VVIHLRIAPLYAEHPVYPVDYTNVLGRFYGELFSPRETLKTSMTPSFPL
jgi:hypothetical protein